jgi:Cof subfamily protein (haloacid dehalogenase superfamily)
MTMTSSIKLVALDVDGTLVGPELQITPRCRAAIDAARHRGVRFVIVTGRMYKSGAPYAAELGLEDLPLVAYNGALVREFPSGRTIFHQPVPLAACLELAALCEARGYHLQAYVNDDLYVPDMGHRTELYKHIARVEATPVGPLSRWFREPSTKLLIIDDPERIKQIQAEVGELLGPSVHAAPSHPIFLEIVDHRVSKATALEAVAASLGVERSAVMAVGDGMNDMPMLTWAGISFAMGHAPEALRQVATYVTEAGPGDGVAEALERIGLV